jgi:KAP family P-loop domain
MNTDQEKILKDLYNGLLKGEPLEPNDPRYVNLSEGPEPIAALEKHIRWATNESTQFFSGYRGSGKTTQLKLLQKNLRNKQFVVMYADALDYINPSGEITISELLITLAGSFNDQMEAQMGVQPLQESYWQRIGRFLQSDIQIKELNLGGKVNATPAELQATIKAELKTPTPLRKKFQTQLEYHVSPLKAQVDQFFEDAIKAIRAKMGADTQVVFIFDSLEQLRGSAITENKVLESVQEIFNTHLERLSIPNVHTVYTVPPWLNLLLPGKLQITMIYTPKLWEKASRQEHAPGILHLKDVVQKRVNATGWNLIFGSDPDGNRHVRAMIDASGGHVRDLLRMLQSVIRNTETLPVSDAVIQSAIAELRESYKNISIEDAQLLDLIGRTNRLVRQNQTEINRLSLLLDLHLALYFRNGEDWYDVHPLVRDEVTALMQIAQQNPANPTP